MLLRVAHILLRKIPQNFMALQAIDSFRLHGGFFCCWLLFLVFCFVLFYIAHRDRGKSQSKRLRFLRTCYSVNYALKQRNNVVKWTLFINCLRIFVYSDHRRSVNFIQIGGLSILHKQAIRLSNAEVNCTF